MENKKCGTVSSFHVLGTLVTLLLLTFNLSTCSAARAHPNRQSSTEFIRTSCSATTYPRVCFHSLSAYANTINTSPKLLAHTALLISLKGARSTSTIVSKLSEQHNINHKELGAAMDCTENMADSIEELQQSLSEMGHLDGVQFGFRMSNIQTWVSAALTDEDTCLEGFEDADINGSVKTLVRRHVLHVAKLTSNALALINGLATTQATTP